MTFSLRIFIVEDEPIILMNMQALLEDAGHTVVGTAMSAPEAIDDIFVCKPELVLLDLHLKDGSSGRDVARAIRDMADLTIVFVTANMQKLDVDMDGAAAAIAKPYSDQLLEGSLAYFGECVHRPPPQLEPPYGLHLAPAYQTRLDDLR